MTRSNLTLMLLLATAIVGQAAAVSATEPPWGFFGHRRINRLATFTLPEAVMPLFRANIDYLTEHAVDPDKRRYATKHEAVRHYIDVDHWGVAPFLEVPRDLVEAIQKYATIKLVGAPGDTTEWRFDTLIYDRVLLKSMHQTIDLDAGDYRRVWHTTLLPAAYGEEGALSVMDSLTGIGFPASRSALVVDSFSTFGILPYHLLRYHRRLTDAFAGEDTGLLLQLSAEMGHYVADAHVPLHTTENYDGQLTGQEGIHSFWESRLPELFGDLEYDYFVGKAAYIEDPKAFYWDIVLHSSSLVDSVFNTERRLRQTFPTSLQLCREERGGREVNIPCEEYSRAWSEAMNGMVEDQFRASIHAVGSVWYSCWVDAGQPDLRKFGAKSVEATDSLSNPPPMHEEEEGDHH